MGKLARLYNREAITDARVWVLRMRKSGLSPQLEGVIPGIPASFTNTYDLLVYDGDHRGNVTVTPDLAQLVTTGNIAPGSYIELTHCVCKVDGNYTKAAAGVAAPPQLALIACAVKLLTSTKDLEELESEAEDADYPQGAIPSYRPLFSCRATYISGLTDDLAYEVPSFARVAVSASKSSVQHARRQLEQFNELLKGQLSPYLLYQATDENANRVDDGFESVRVPILGTSSMRLASLADVAAQYASQLTERHVVIEDEGMIEGLTSASGKPVPSRKRARGFGELGSEPPWLVGRINYVSRITYWGKRTITQNWPYNFRFSLKDGSRSLVITVWNASVAKWHRALSAAGPGALVAILGYRFKPMQKDPTTFECSLNGGDKEAVFRIDEDHLITMGSSTSSSLQAVRTGDMFPTVDLVLCPSNTLLKHIGAGKRVSFAGIIARVGPVCRTPVYQEDIGDLVDTTERGEWEEASSEVAHASKIRDMFNAHADTQGPQDASDETTIVKRVLASAGELGPAPCSGIMYMYRWVWLRDGSSSRDIAVKLYTNSDEGVFNRCRPGELMLVTKMKVVATRPCLGELDGEDRSMPANGQQRSLYLHSTPSSQAYTYDTSNWDKVPFHESVIGKLTLAKALEPAGACAEAVAVFPSPLYPLLYAVVEFSDISRFSIAKRGFALDSTNPRGGTQYVSSLNRPRSLRAYIERMTCAAQVHRAYANENGSLTAALPVLSPAQLTRLRNGIPSAARAIAVVSAQRPLGRTGMAAEMGPLEGEDSTVVGRPVTSILSEYVTLQQHQLVRVLVPAKLQDLKETLPPPAPKQALASKRQARKGKGKGKVEEEEEVSGKRRSSRLADVPAPAPSRSKSAAPLRYGAESASSGRSLSRGRRGPAFVSTSAHTVTIRSRSSPRFASASSSSIVSRRVAFASKSGRASNANAGVNTGGMSASSQSSSSSIRVLHARAEKGYMQSLATAVSAMAARLVGLGFTTSSSGEGGMAPTHISGRDTPMVGPQAMRDALVLQEVAASASASVALPLKGSHASPASEGELLPSHVQALTGEDMTRHDPADDDGSIGYMSSDHASRCWMEAEKQVLDRRATWLTKKAAIAAVLGAGAGGLGKGAPRALDGMEDEVQEVEEGVSSRTRHRRSASARPARQEVDEGRGEDPSAPEPSPGDAKGSAKGRRSTGGGRGDSRSVSAGRRGGDGDDTSQGSAGSAQTEIITDDSVATNAALRLAKLGPDPALKAFHMFPRPIMVGQLKANPASMLRVAIPCHPAAPGPASARAGQAKGPEEKEEEDAWVLMNGAHALPEGEVGVSAMIPPGKDGDNAWLAEHWASLQVVTTLRTAFFAKFKGATVKEFADYVNSSERDFVFCLTVHQRALHASASIRTDGDGGAPVSAVVRVEAVYDLSDPTESAGLHELLYGKAEAPPDEEEAL